MDPLTAIGLVGNIIAFVDFGVKVINNAREIYDSASGATEDAASQVIHTGLVRVSSADHEGGKISLKNMARSWHLDNEKPILIYRTRVDHVQHTRPALHPHSRRQTPTLEAF